VRCLYTLGMPNSDATRDARIAAFKTAYAPQLGANIGATAYCAGIWDAVGWQRVFPDWAYDRHFARSIRYALGIPRGSTKAFLFTHSTAQQRRDQILNEDYYFGLATG
jgi:hypothetical protein